VFIIIYLTIAILIISILIYVINWFYLPINDVDYYRNWLSDQVINHWLTQVFTNISSIKSNLYDTYYFEFGMFD